MAIVSGFMQLHHVEKAKLTLGASVPILPKFNIFLTLNSSLTLPQCLFIAGEQLLVSLPMCLYFYPTFFSEVSEVPYASHSR